MNVYIYMYTDINVNEPFEPFFLQLNWCVQEKALSWLYCSPQETQNKWTTMIRLWTTALAKQLQPHAAHVVLLDHPRSWEQNTTYKLLRSTQQLKRSKTRFPLVTLAQLHPSCFTLGFRFLPEGDQSLAGQSWLDRLQGHNNQQRRCLDICNYMCTYIDCSYIARSCCCAGSPTAHPDMPGTCVLWILHTSSTAQDCGGSFKNRKPIGEVGWCESRMAERIHWWTDRWLELCFLKWLQWLQWLQWSPYQNCWMQCGVAQLQL